MITRLPAALLVLSLLAACAPAPAQDDGPAVGETVYLSDEPVPSASPSDPPSGPAPTGAPTVSCDWKALPPGAPKEVKDVGRPAGTVPGQGKATLTFTTNLGPVVVAMDAARTPCAVASFAYLAGKRFFEGSSCHRLVAAETLHVLQCGDPSGTGMGGPTYRYAEEDLASLPPDPSYRRGMVAIAKTSEPGTSGSQFFVVLKDSGLSKDYTQLGTVTAGLELIDQVAAGGIGTGPYATADDGPPKTKLTLQRVTVTYA